MVECLITTNEQKATVEEKPYKLSFSRVEALQLDNLLILQFKAELSSRDSPAEHPLHVKHEIPYVVRAKMYDGDTRIILVEQQKNKCVPGVLESRMEQAQWTEEVLDDKAEQVATAYIINNCLGLKH